MRNNVTVLILMLMFMAVSLQTQAEETFPIGSFNLEGWHMTQSFPGNRVDIKTMKYPRFYTIFFSNWQAVTPDKTGRVDVSVIRKAVGDSPGVVLARTIVYAEKKQPLKLSLRYGAEAALFLNGQKMFYGGHDDPQPPPMEFTLQKGRNEICLALKQGIKQGKTDWYFTCRSFKKLNSPLKDHSRLEPVWQTPKSFLTPESVCYDKKRKVLYVSNFDNRFNPKAVKEEEFTGYISRLSMDGKILELKWVAGLHAPCGMAIVKDQLFTVERKHLTAIDIESGKVVKRFPIPNPGFPNDITADEAGNIYISDTSPANHLASRIYKFDGQTVETWLDTDDIYRANGLFIHKGKLLVGNSGDGFLKSVTLGDKKVSIVTCLGAGIIDGIRVDKKGRFLVSHWEGWVYSISPEGKVVEVMDTLPKKINSADFEFVKEENLLIIPTFSDNRVMAYRLKD